MPYVTSIHIQSFPTTTTTIRTPGLALSCYIPIHEVSSALTGLSADITSQANVIGLEGRNWGSSFGNQTVLFPGGEPQKLSPAVKRLADEANGVRVDHGESTESSMWLEADLPRGYTNITSQLDVTGLKLLNWDSM